MHWQVTQGDSLLRFCEGADTIHRLQSGLPWHMLHTELLHRTCSLPGSWVEARLSRVGAPTIHSSSLSSACGPCRSSAARLRVYSPRPLSRQPVRGWMQSSGQPASCSTCQVCAKS